MSIADFFLMLASADSPVKLIGATFSWPESEGMGTWGYGEEDREQDYITPAKSHNKPGQHVVQAQSIKAEECTVFESWRSNFFFTTNIRSLLSKMKVQLLKKRVLLGNGTKLQVLVSVPYQFKFQWY